MHPRLSKIARVGYASFAFLLMYALALDSFLSIRSALVPDSFFSIRIRHDFLVSVPTLVALILCATLALAARSRWFVKLPGVLASLSYRRVFILALALRLSWVLLSGVEQTSDLRHYDRMAMDILDGKYVTFHGRWQTGPSLFFALHYLIFGHVLLLPQISQAVLSALQVILVYDITARTTNDSDAGKLAALALTLWPEHILYNNLLGTDVLHSTFILVAVWLLSPAIERYSLAVLGAGISLGIAHWMRATAPLFLVGALVFVVFASSTSGGWRASLKPALVLVGGFMLVVSPIILLNYSALGVVSLSPVQGGGKSMMVGTNIEYMGRVNRADKRLLADEVQRSVRQEGEHLVVFDNRVAREIAFGRIREQPFRFLYMALTDKVSRLWAWPAGLSWSLETSSIKGLYLYIYGMAKVWQLLTLFVCGIVLFVKSRWECPWDERQVYVWAALLTTAALLFLEVQPRYHHMFLPFLAICLGESILILKRRGKLSEKPSL